MGGAEVKKFQVDVVGVLRKNKGWYRGRCRGQDFSHNLMGVMKMKGRGRFPGT